MAALSSECKEKLKATSKPSQSYDKSAPSTIAERKQARGNYFEYYKTIYEIEDENAMYSRETLIDFVCGFVECIATTSEGVLSDKPKAFHIQTLTLIRN